MRLVKIGVAAVSVKVGDFTGNSARLRAVIEHARQEQVHLLVTPELALSGYSLEDRIWWPDIARRSWKALEALTAHTHGISVFVGLPVRIQGMMYNGLAFLHDGRIRGIILKKYLPTYSIFYEGRNWTAWSQGVVEHMGVPAGELVFDLPYGKVSAEICEDMWSADSPAHDRVLAGAEIICNGSASPFTPRKNLQRRRMVVNAAEHLACVYAYANILGLDNSRLVFDGGGLIAAPHGIVTEGPLLSKKMWTLATGVVNLDDVGRARNENSTWRQGAARPNDASIGVVPVGGTFASASVAEYAKQLPKSFFVPDAQPVVDEVVLYLDELFDALVLGLRDYFEKVGVFSRFLIALSGGRDSALCLLLAVHAAKALKEGTEADRFAERVSTIYLPNRAYSTSATEEAARGLAEALGVPFQVVSIAEEAELALAKAGEVLGDASKVTELGKQRQRIVAGDVELERGRRGLHHDRRRQPGRVFAHRQCAENPRQPFARLHLPPRRARRTRKDSGHSSQRGTCAEPGG